MSEEALSPRIAKLSWGRLELEDGRVFKDAILYPGGAREWDWNETGTGHSQGIQPADVEELLERGVKTVVLSRGKLGRLNVSPETLELLENKGVPVHIGKTDEAVRFYNETRESDAVGGLFHSTC